ncbi:MAG TPA: FHA domain-containing protein, partial [Roseiflexaceae bacterium]|nr:FHA domain-containing protein [Roseiflexaceae bacterium]
ELAALTGGVAPAATPAVEPPVAAPDEVAAPAAPVVIEAEPAPIGPNEPTIFSPIDAVPPPLPPTPAAAPAARLVVENGGATLPLPTDRSEIVVGREDPISGIHPEVDMTPYGGETGGVSRQHARITRSDGVWMIVDLNSTNYTRVDGIKLDPGVPMALKDGSKIQFGRVTVIFHE